MQIISSKIKLFNSCIQVVTFGMESVNTIQSVNQFQLSWREHVQNENIRRTNAEDVIGNMVKLGRRIKALQLFSGFDLIQNEI